MKHMQILALMTLSPGCFPVSAAQSIPPREAGISGVLEALSAAVREIESGKTTLLDLHNQRIPDRLMSSIRGHVKSDPGTKGVLLSYLRSKEQPIAARLIAVLSLSHCWEPHILEAAKAILSEPMDERLGSAYVRGYWIVEFEQDPEWTELLPSLRSLGGLGPEYDCPRPDSFGGFRGWSATIPRGVNPAPMLDGLLNFMARQKDRPGPDGFGLACEIYLKSPEPMTDLRARFRPFLENLYLSDLPDANWRVSMDALVRSTARPGHLEIIARGLERFSSGRRMETINELCAYGGESILQKRFRQHVDEALEHLGGQSPDAPLGSGTPYLLMGHLLLYGAEQGWPEFLLQKSPSINLRRRAAQNLEVFMQPGSPPSNWQPWMDMLGRMLKDPDLETQFSAACALINGLNARWQRLNKPAYGDQVDLWRGRMKEWLENAPKNHPRYRDLKSRMKG